MEIQVSIVICTYNRARFLPTALESLKNQTIESRAYEIVVINNNSTDTTEVLCLAFQKANPNLNFKYVIEPKQGLSHARNTGIEVASGKYIAFIDDDAIADPNYAKSIAKAFETYPDYDALGGKITPIYESITELKWLSKYLWGMVAKVDNGDKIEPFTKKYPAGCNMVFRKEVFSTIGNFNPNLANRCDDRFIFSQMKNFGKKTLYYPTASVNHFIPDDRITEEGIVRLSRLNGVEYRNLLSHSSWKSTMKLFDYLLKVLLALVLSLIFLLKGEPEKTKIVKIMYFSLVGFITKK